MLKNAWKTIRRVMAALTGQRREPTREELLAFAREIGEEIRETLDRAYAISAPVAAEAFQTWKRDGVLPR